MKLTDQEQVILKAIEHVAGSRNGLASVPAVTRAVNYPISTTQKILAALHRREIIALHHHDFPAQMTADEKKRAVKIGNDYFHAVAIRNPAMGENVNVEKLPKAQRAAIEDLIERVNKRGGWIKLTHGTRGKVIVETEYGTAARDKQGKSTSINPAGNMKRGAAKSNPSPAQLKARAAFTRMAKARAKAAKKANPPGMGEKAGRAADAKVRKSINGYLAQGWDFQKIKDRVWLYYGYTLIALDAEKATFTSLFQKGGWILYLNPKRGGVSSVKTNPAKRTRAANPRYLVSATDARGNIADLGVLVSPNKTQAVARAKKLYKGYKKFTAATVDKGDYIGPKGVVKIRRKRATKKANGIAKTAGRAIKKVTRAVLGGVSKVAGKGAKALKNPRMKASVRQGHIWNAVTGLIRDGYTQAQSIKLMEQSGFPAKDIADAKKIFATAKHEVEHGRNPARRRNLDHRDSSHQVKVHQHWRAGGLSQWQRAHHAGQHDLFSHGIKAKPKRNPGAIDYYLRPGVLTAGLSKPSKEHFIQTLVWELDGGHYTPIKLQQALIRAGLSREKAGAAVRKAQTKSRLEYQGVGDLKARAKRKAKARRPAHTLRRNPSASAIRKKFAGRVSGQKTLYFPKGAPQGLAKLGRLVSIKLKGGKLIKPSRRNPSAEIWLCSDTSGKLWLGCTKAGPLYAGAPGDLGEMSVLEYAESKPHLGYANNTIWFHKMGEVSGRRPHLIVNDDQDLLIKGGNYKITRAGIVD